MAGQNTLGWGAPASVQRFALLADVRGNKACSNIQIKNMSVVWTVLNYLWCLPPPTMHKKSENIKMMPAKLKGTLFYK